MEVSKETTNETIKFDSRILDQIHSTNTYYSIPAYSLRFSLCVLDIIRRLQQLPEFEKGVEKCYIEEVLRNLPGVDGDLSSQISIALRDLECYGYLMRLKCGYKTIGPFAKLCMARTVKQRKILWRRLDLKYNHSYTEFPAMRNQSNTTIDNPLENNGSSSASISIDNNSSNGSSFKTCRRTKSETNLLKIKPKNSSLILKDQDIQEDLEEADENQD